MIKWNSGIYQIRNLINNKRYIGQTNNFSRRKNEQFSTLENNKSNNIHLQRAYNKYGKEKFIFEILEYVNLSNDDEYNKLILFNREDDWIKFYFPNTYNIRPSASSNLGIKRSEEVKKKMSESRKGFKHTKQARKNMSDARKGKKCLSRTKEKISKTLKGRIRSEQERTNISKSKMKKCCQLDINTNEILMIWDSPIYASKELNVSRSTISNACLYNKQAVGFKWKYI